MKLDVYIYIYMTVSRSVLFRMRNIVDTRCRENQNEPFIPNIFFFEYRVFYDVMWKSMVQTDWPQMTM
jgi:hypothetical protein